MLFNSARITTAKTADFRNLLVGSSDSILWDYVDSPEQFLYSRTMN